MELRILLNINILTIPELLRKKELFLYINLDEVVRAGDDLAFVGDRGQPEGAFPVVPQGQLQYYVPSQLERKSF